ncbi:acetate--CoA ligase family protein [Haladaptatus sp. YSMS36]|uniref:acetate--CoA ligase family protein n=1 Tax=Haladaptatus sp. YSMS36 TaxID=3033384 RepID=UPI0023E82C29|nr:acetate--CoA ligase family protein [Haladaptatus sp. YSMS36]
MGTLSSLFAPERVAVIGATEREGSVGRAITANLLADFVGETIPVNPNADTVLGVESYEDIATVPGDVDLAIVVVPPAVAVDVVREVGEAGVANVVVITAGFSETGSGGAAREAELTAVATEYDLNLVGPNSLGVIATDVGMNATFGPENALPGSISFMSQSGAFITAVLDWANDRDIGFRDVVSLGNKAVLDESDFIREWGDDEGTDVIMGYLEAITDGEGFVRTAREVTQDTPIVLVKSGRTEAGARAASSHTGAIAGSERAYETGLEQAGVLRVETVQDLFDFAGILSGQPLPNAGEVAIVTNAGGPGVMTTDAVGDSSLSLASLSPATLDALGESMPEETNIHNPIDVIGDAGIDRFETAIDLALADDRVGCAVVLTCPTAVLDFEDFAAAVIDLQATHDKPVAACLMGGDSTREAEAALNSAGIPTYFDPARAVRSLDALWRYRTIRDREYQPPTEFDVDHEQAREILDAAKERGQTQLGVEAMDLLSAYGIPTPTGAVVDSAADAVSTAQDIGDPEVVMKIVSPDIPHKSDIGGVKVGVALEDVYDAYEDLVTRAREYQPNATILGVQVQELLDVSGGTETIVGMNRDPQFGPLVMFGLGGIFVEVLEDATFRVAPVSERDATAMLDEIKTAPLLRGARGREPVDRAAIADTIQRISQLVCDFPEILELDINPLVATPAGATAIDLRLTIDQ